ncbi:hypothetical protein GCM10009559_81820 [Pseudonocardia zijingensis]|uniref:Uncharacterized protein n=1 Tax=Pseudonocardia zijingensis TaxID=153376 RepID=A0ABN1NKQ7_9PSEU
MKQSITVAAFASTCIGELEKSCWLIATPDPYRGSRVHHMTSCGTSAAAVPQEPGHPQPDREAASSEVVYESLAGARRGVVM